VAQLALCEALQAHFRVRDVDQCPIWLFNFAFQVLTGMFVPLQVLPQALRTIGIYTLPQRLSMDLLRHYVMGTRTVTDVPHEWVILAGQLVGYGLLARVAIKRLERTAREEGLHYL
jgi:ABC-2 type transport system permease protein